MKVERARRIEFTWNVALMIDIDAILLDLPGDPIPALIEIGRRIRQDSSMKDEPQTKIASIRIAIRIIEEWCAKNKINFKRLHATNKQDVLIEYLRQIDEYQNKMLEDLATAKVEEALRGDILAFGYARLDPTEKDDLHNHLHHIRQIIERSDIPDNKKNALLKKLNQLSEEVDRTGTRTDGFLGLIGDLGVRLGQFGKDARPLTKELNSLLRIVMRSRARAEDIALPKSEDFPLLGPAESDPYEPE